MTAISQQLARDHGWQMMAEPNSAFNRAAVERLPANPVLKAAKASSPRASVTLTLKRTGGNEPWQRPTTSFQSQQVAKKLCVWDPRVPKLRLASLALPRCFVNTGKRIT